MALVKHKHFKAFSSFFKTIVSETLRSEIERDEFISFPWKSAILGHEATLSRDEHEEKFYKT